MRRVLQAVDARHKHGDESFPRESKRLLPADPSEAASKQKESGIFPSDDTAPSEVGRVPGTIEPMPADATRAGDTVGQRLDILDGWRAVSILCVLAGHWLPLGPHPWGLNAAVATAGMALFFTLSGFLIVRLLLGDPRAMPFLIRRCFRIVPLAWVTMSVLFVAGSGDLRGLLANLLFVANLPPDHLLTGGSHLWSLCVEVQFYGAIALAVTLAGRRGLFLLLPLGALAVTAARVAANQPISIVTWHRVDEILAGGCLALIVHSDGARTWLARLPNWLPVLLLPWLIGAGLPFAGPLAYARPYLAAGLVGLSLFSVPAPLRAMLSSRPARYVAHISYAVYVIHGMLGATWLGSGDGLVKYAKRPLLAAATFLLAHWSTYRFEAPMIGVGKRLAQRVATRVTAPRRR